MEIADYSAYDMFTWYKVLIVNLGFSHIGFYSLYTSTVRYDLLKGLDVPSGKHVYV